MFSNCRMPCAVTWRYVPAFRVNHLLPKCAVPLLPCAFVCLSACLDPCVSPDISSSTGREYLDSASRYCNLDAPFAVRYHLGALIGRCVPGRNISGILSCDVCWWSRAYSQKLLDWRRGRYRVSKKRKRLGEGGEPTSGNSQRTCRAHVLRVMLYIARFHTHWRVYTVKPA